MYLPIDKPKTLLSKNSTRVKFFSMQNSTLRTSIVLKGHHDKKKLTSRLLKSSIILYVQEKYRHKIDFIN